MTAPLHTLAVGTQIVWLPGHAVNIGTRAEPSPGPGDDHHPDGIVEP